MVVSNFLFPSWYNSTDEPVVNTAWVALSAAFLISTALPPIIKLPVPSSTIAL